MKSRQSRSTTRTSKTAVHSPDQRIEMIQVAAYYLAERRAFDGSGSIDDWLEAEVEIDRLFQVERGQKLSGKQSFQQKLEAQLKEWDAKLDELKEKAPGLKGKIRAEYEIQLEALAENKASANEKLQDLRRHMEDAWEDLKEGLEGGRGPICALRWSASPHVSNNPGGAFGASFFCSTNNPITEEKEGKKLIRCERYYGNVYRSFTLGQDVDQSAAKAKYADGVLELTLPKKPGATVKELAIS